MNLSCYFNLNWLFLLNFWIYSKKISYIGSFAIPIICQCVRDKFSLSCTILHFFHCSTAECAGNMVKRHFKTSELIPNFTVLNGNHIWFLDLNEKIQKITKKLYAWGIEPTSKKFYKKNLPLVYCCLYVGTVQMAFKRWQSIINFSGFRKAGKPLKLENDRTELLP